MAMTDVATAKETLCYVKKESSFGTMTVVPAATDAVYVLGDVGMPWNREILEDEQHRNTPSEYAQLAGRYSPAEYNLETYVKPSGTAGTPPEVTDLLECAIGTYTNTPATRDAYTLNSSALSSFSLWVKIGHTVFVMAGCTVNQLVIPVTGTAFGRFQFSGMGTRKYWAGTGTAGALVSAGASTIAMTAGHENRFSVGAYISLGSDTNTYAGYKITAIDTSTHVMTFTPVAVTGCAKGASITGTLPATATEVGSPVFGKLGQLTKDGTNMNVLNATITLNNNLKYYEEEKNNSLYISEFGRPGKREVTIAMNAYYYKEHADMFAAQLNRTKMDFVIPVGSTAGSICTVYVPASGAGAAAGVEINNPDISGDEEKAIAIEGKALASASYNDEFSLIFT